MNELRVLTVRQPWAWAIVHGGKDVENRVRNIAGSYRGPVAIHAGLQDDVDASPGLFFERLQWHAEQQGIDHSEQAPLYSDRGSILGVVDLVDVHGAAGYWTRENEWQLGCCETPWAETGFTQGGGLVAALPTHMVLANPRPLREPISFKGALGLRRLDEETTAAVWSQIGEKP